MLRRNQINVLLRRFIPVVLVKQIFISKTNVLHNTTVKCN